MNRTHLLTLFVLCQFTFCGVKAQNEGAYEKIFDSREVYFYGLDFSGFKLANAKRINEDMRGYLMAWSSYFASQVDPNDLMRWLRKDTVYYRLQAVEKINKELDKDQIVSLYRHDLSTHELQKHIERLEIEEKEGVGLVGIVECFEKEETKSSAYFVFFDISTKKILMAERVSTKEVGRYGITQYWGTGLIFLSKTFVDKVYLPKKRMYEKGTISKIQTSKLSNISDKADTSNNFHSEPASAGPLTKNDVYEVPSIVFYGYDFSLFKLYDTENRNWDIDQYMFKWIGRLVEEVPDKKIEKWLRKDEVIMRHEPTVARNKKLEVNSFQSKAVHKVSVKDLAEQINALIYEEESGIGFIVFWECFNRPAMDATGYFVFFDLHTREILDFYYISAYYESKYNQLAGWSKNQYFAFKYFSDEYRRKSRMSDR